jgi:ABC-type transporter Mla subunit MlaD
MGDAFRQANFEGLSRKAEKTLDEMNRLLEKERWDEILESFREAIQSADLMFARAEQTFSRIESILGQKSATLGEVLEDLRETARSAGLFLDKASSLAGGTEKTLSAMRSELIATARNLERASRNLDRLMEVLVEQPSQLLFGEPPPEREMRP